MAEDGKRSLDGFEWDGRFYPWSVTDRGKDLLLIDRIAQMSPVDFFELLEDDNDRQRSPVVLTMIATSIRAENPDWTVQRVERAVLNMSLGDDITYLDSDEEETDGPPAQGGHQEPPSESSTSPADASSPSSTPPAPSPSESSSAGSTGSTSPGSPTGSPAGALTA